MRIVVFGSGGVGGFFGGKLAQAGFDVTLIARGKHLDAISRNGLKVKSINGDFHVDIDTREDISLIENIDLIVVAVKSWQIEGVADLIKPAISENTLVLPLLNGANISERFRQILPAKQVISGLCRIVSHIEAPGIINHFAFERPEIIFGNDDGRVTDELEKIKSVFDKAGIHNKLSQNIRLDIWQKFLFITTVSGIAALTRSVFGVIRDNPNIRQIMRETAEEIVALANAVDVPLDDSDIATTFRAIDNTIYNTTASMQRDIMSGRPSELDNFNGFVVRKGAELGISTPVNSFIYYCLLPQENAARKS